MKLISIHKREGLTNIEFNHKLYSRLFNCEYEKYYVRDVFAEKYSLILQKLQENDGETLIFIDSDSFFKNMERLPELKKDIYVQKTNDKINDNLLLVKSNSNTQKIFYEILLDILSQKGANDINLSVDLRFPEEYVVEYPFYFEENNFYMNISLKYHPEAFDVPKIYVANTVDIAFAQPTSYYFAEVLCNKNQIRYEDKEEQYECINPGKKNAIVTLYTPNIKQVGLVAEKNLSLYCKYHDITLYVYRDTPDDLKEKGIGPSWAKADLLLDKWEEHEHIAWVDSDILIGKDYKINFKNEILCFNDPYWPMNSGFMLFETNEKNKELLETVIKDFHMIDGDLDGVYKHKGDQYYFTNRIREYYPNYVFRSSNLGNSHPSIPRHISPTEDDVMLHFMGYPHEFRYHVMDGFSRFLNKKME